MRQTSQNGQKRIPWAQFGHTDKARAGMVAYSLLKPDLPDTREPLACSTDRLGILDGTAAYPHLSGLCLCHASRLAELPALRHRLGGPLPP
jgi:hypothetical protein